MAIKNKESIEFTSIAGSNPNNIKTKFNYRPNAIDLTAQEWNDLQAKAKKHTILVDATNTRRVVPIIPAQTLITVQ